MGVAPAYYSGINGYWSFSSATVTLGTGKNYSENSWPFQTGIRLLLSCPLI